MPECPIRPTAPLLPHSGHMVLLDEVLAYDSQSLHATATLRPNCLLLPAGSTSLPVWMGMEIMAQGIAAWSGAHALDRGEPVRLGFLLGSRKLTLGVSEIPVGTVLDIHIALSLEDNLGMGVFDCSLNCRQPAPGHEHNMPPGMVLLSGSLNVYSPKSDQALQEVVHKQQ